MNQIKHVFFDLDHTLWDFEKNSRETLLHLFNEHSLLLNCSPEAFLAVYETINFELWQLYAFQKITKEELRYQRFYKTFLHFNYDNVNLAKIWADDYLKISPYKTHLIEDAIEVLNYLTQKNYNLHIITNGFREVQDIKLEQSGLKIFFNHIIISEDHGFSKPDVKIFELAQLMADTDYSKCIMIGDSYENDITGALNANWKAIYLSDKPVQNPNTNFYQVTKLRQIKSLL